MISIATSLIIVFLVFTAPVMGAYNVGVKAGDWVQYGHIVATWSGSGQGTSTIPGLNQTQYLKGTVQSVSGTNVTIKADQHFVNNTDKNQIATGNITSGAGNLTFLLIPSGLNQGDTIPVNLGTSQNILTIKINDTTTRTYAGVSRTVDEFNSTYSQSNSYISVSYAFHMYWDQATGFLVEVSLIYTTGGSYCGSSCGTAKDSFSATQASFLGSGDLLGGSSNLLLYVGIVVIVVAAIGGGIYFLVIKKPATASTPTTTPTTGLSTAKS